MDEKGVVTLGMVAGVGSIASYVPLHLILAQEATDPTSQWITILQQFGPFLPFALLCLTIMQLLWKKIGALEKQLSDAQQVTIGKVIPALTDTNSLLSKNTEELARATEVLRSVNARPEMDPDTWRRMINALERSERGGGS